MLTVGIGELLKSQGIGSFNMDYRNKPFVTRTRLMKRLVIYIFILIGFVNRLAAQFDVKEQVYLHLNSQTLISGQTLYYSAYNNSQATGQQSNLSKVLYIEIIGKEGLVHQEKLSLKDGRGQGDLFISSVIPSGQYHLLAYTRWMKNFDNYFHAPLLIVNPYEAYPQPQLETKPKIDFYTVEAALVAGITNMVAYHIPTNVPEQFEGKLVSEDGTILHRLIPDEMGLGKFSITPNEDETYQVILEDSLGNISFHALPSVKSKGSSIQYEEKPDELHIQFETNEFSTKQVNYQILSFGELMYEGVAVTDRIEKISKRTLPPGILTIQASFAKNKTLNRKIWVGRDELSPKQLQTFGKRQPVTIPVELEAGRYSVSVKRQKGKLFDGHTYAAWIDAVNDLLSAPIAISSYLQSEDFDPEVLMLVASIRDHKAVPNSIRFLPEVREEIMTGIVFDSLGNPLKNKRIALAFPGEQYQLRISESDGRGKFVIPFKSSFSDHESIITSVDFEEYLKIIPESPFLSVYPEFNFDLPFLNSLQVAELVSLSVRNQIENAYYVSDEGLVIENNWFIDLPYDDQYDLDNYERFPTIKETFVEYVVSANVRERRDYPIRTTYFPGLGQETYPPLVLLDGVPVKGAELLDYDQSQVKSIKVVSDRYYLGSYIMDGIVDVTSKSKSLSGFKLSENYLKLPVMGLSNQHAYSFPDYSSSKLEQLPDQRDQLFWDPRLSHPGGERQISFYTSDVSGNYEVVIEGFSNSGEPVTKIFQFKIN